MAELRIENDLAYPMYYFSFNWSEDITDDKKYEGHWIKDLPEGRIWNATSFTKMFKEEKTQEQLDEICNNWAKDYFEHQKEKISNPLDITFSHKFKEFETWHLTWFCHETFRTEELDLEEKVLDSFKRYVTRKIQEIYNEERNSPDGLARHTLMGADDRWRWRGETQDHGAPCRCKQCEQANMWRINH